ncbi:MAG: hypothetical protein ABW321_01975 [Polyangiales bacterium]
MSRLGSQQKLRHITLGFFLTAAAGCAGQIPETQHGRAAGEWQVHLPSSDSAVHGLAYGRGGSSTPAEPVVLASLDDVLRADPQVASERAAKRSVRHKAPAAPTGAPVAPTQESAPAKPISAPPPAAKQPIQLAMADTSMTADTSAEARYAERETQSRQQEQFRGGDAIVIGAGTLVVILLIVLLVLLLT